MTEKEIKDTKDTEAIGAEDESADEKKPKGGGFSIAKLAIPVLSVLLIAALSVIGTTMYLGTGSTVTAKNVAAAGEATADGKFADKKTKKDKKKKKKKKKELPNTVLYHPLDPAFVINFDQDEEVHFLQISIEVMAYDERVIQNVEKHAPAIRNGLVMLLSKQKYHVLNTQEGKEKLRSDALSEVQKVLKEYTGEAGVEAVYFTAFVIQ